jgi:hypothetical protein
MTVWDNLPETEKTMPQLITKLTNNAPIVETLITQQLYVQNASWMKGTNLRQRLEQ